MASRFSVICAMLWPKWMQFIYKIRQFSLLVSRHKHKWLLFLWISDLSQNSTQTYIKYHKKPFKMSLREIENERYRIRRKRNFRKKLLRNMKENYVFFWCGINSYHVSGRKEREKTRDEDKKEWNNKKSQSAFGLLSNGGIQTMKLLAYTMHNLS